MTNEQRSLLLAVFRKSIVKAACASGAGCAVVCTQKRFTLPRFHFRWSCGEGFCALNAVGTSWILGLGVCALHLIMNFRRSEGESGSRQSV